MKSASKAMTFERAPIRKSVSRDFIREADFKALDKVSMGRIVKYLAVRFYHRFDTEIYALSFFGSWAVYIFIKYFV